MSSFERIIPLLIYRDIAAAHEFLARVFGFEAGDLVRDSDGAAIHGEVRVAGNALWLHRITGEHQPTSPEGADLAGAGMVVHVSDVDAHFEKIRAAGARIQYGPTDQPYGQREYEARDLEGHRWWFATPLVDA